LNLSGKTAHRPDNQDYGQITQAPHSFRKIGDIFLPGSKRKQSQLISLCWQRAFRRAGRDWTGRKHAVTARFSKSGYPAFFT
jgi:hypothetical protein